MKISGESIDSRILAEFGLQGGRRLAKTLEGLIPTNKEDLEQERFEAKWSSVGALTACQDMAEKGVEGILRGQNRSETRVGRVMRGGDRRRIKRVKQNLGEVGRKLLRRLTHRDSRLR